MNCAKLYSSASEMQRRDAAEAITRYVGSMTWMDDCSENVLDVGCGSGEVTRRLLLPILPATGQLTAVDTSEVMIRFASARHKHPRLSFRKMDILTANPRMIFPHGFRKVFSFFCLHWVPDQRQALKNVYDLLVPGGEALLVFLASSPTFNVYEQLAVSSRWGPYMKDYEKFISPYHHSISPRQDLLDILLETGFDVRICECRERIFVFNGVPHLKDAVIAVNPFMDRIPKDEHDEYISDFLKESEKLKTKVHFGDGKITTKYHLFEVLVRKIKH